nr:immunoglobulin heavy chain junction region [Mus musculus]MBK4188143.1 immunoglobulin heavy chain junction region [Mus musculus]
CAREPYYYGSSYFDYW